MTVKLSPVFQTDSAQVDANGNPRSGGLLFSYLAGTTTKTTTYKTSSGSGGASHTNPIVLDANGLPPAPIWLSEGSLYKLVLAPAGDTDPPASALQTFDNITPINDVADVVATEWTPSGMTPTYVSALTFTVPGDQTAILSVNRRLKLTVTAGTLYAAIISSVYTSLTTIKLLIDNSLTLDAGLSAFSYGIISPANTSLPFVSYDQQCGRLIYVSATQIRFDPVKGKTIWVYTAASGWTRREITTAGITANHTSIYINGTSGQSLAASTTYYVYLWDNAGVLTIDYSTTGPAVDLISGLKIKTGNATRLLIGMVRTDGSTPGQFQTPALVLSWYQRRAILKSATFTANQTTASASLVELEAAAEVKFLSWAEEDIHAEYVGYGSGDTTGELETTAITLDGIVTTIATLIVTTPVGGSPTNYSLGGYATVTDGYHYATIAVAASAATGTWAAGKLFVLTQG